MKKTEVPGWRYYNHAVIPTCAPHEEANIEVLKKWKMWKIGGATLFARWTSNWDCGYETAWWYCIKDTPFNIATLKAKRRYEINKGNKHFKVLLIKPIDYKEELYRITVAAYTGWPEKYRPVVQKDSFNKNVEKWKNQNIFGAFRKDNGVLMGYAQVIDYGSYASFSALRTDPKEEREGINASLVAAILEYFSNRFNGKFYICDGERAIRHETAFQDYLGFTEKREFARKQEKMGAFASITCIVITP